MAIKVLRPENNNEANGVNHLASAIIQRVLSASVTVDSEVVSSIGKGMLVLVAGEENLFLKKYIPTLPPIRPFFGQQLS